MTIKTILPKINRIVFTYYFYSSQEKKLVSTKPTITASPSSQKTINASLLNRWGNDTVTKDVADLINNSWAENTRKQYRTYFGQWKEFCQDRILSLTNASISEGSEFLLTLYKTGLSYSVINTAKSMLSMIIPVCNRTEFGNHPNIARMLKGIFRNRPALPRYIVTYDPDLVLNFLKSLPSWNNITLKWLTLKTVTILALLSGYRCQSLNSLTHAHMDISINKVEFYISKVIKNTTRSFQAQPTKLKAYNKDESICAVRAVAEYIKVIEKK